MSIQPINIYPSKPLGSMPPPAPTFYGSGHHGVDMLDRIIMALKSGLPDEVEWGINCLYQQSFVAPGPINLEENEFLGRAIIKYFNAPFEKIKATGELDNSTIILGVNCALSIRNLIQDLTNQQWLSQVYEFKQDLVDILKFLIDWFVYDKKSYKLSQYNDQFMEFFYHLIDILDTLTCYYINNPKDDLLFNLLLDLSTKTTDKFLIIGTLSCLTHLLFTKAESKSAEGEANGSFASETSSEGDLMPIYDNCIDGFTSKHLETYLNYLLLNDPKLNLTVLEFIKQFLSSGASLKNQTVEQSKSTRIAKLLQLSDSKNNLHTLFKSLPTLAVQNLKLNDPEKATGQVTEELVKRTKYSNVPAQAPSLPEDLYNIIANFKEPLRSTTWLRCCYEPIFNDSYEPNGLSSIGEVTQISLWKAYEKQFEPIWKNKTPEGAELLQAVDFIKNVNNAFPSSEAMVIMLDEDDSSKKKFIIRGIQPRQFVVSIDEGNYDALKKRQTISNFDESNAALPIGTVDTQKFQEKLKSASNSGSAGLKLSKINLISRDILDVIYDEVEKSHGSELSVFKLYNSHWLLDTVYANPQLLEKEIVDPKWLKYLL